MTAQTRTTILETAKKLFATNGYEGFSMRILAKESTVGLSSIYHFFSDKDELLKEIFDSTNTELGRKRAHLKDLPNASQMLMQRIVFQFDNIEDVVFVLKYYLHFRPKFLKLDDGYVPSKAYLHIEEVLRVGVTTKEFFIDSATIAKEAKVITHAINGYLLEYYPDKPEGDELNQVAEAIHRFLIRSLTNKEAPMDL